MADLTFTEKRKIERALNMGGGYVLNFSNKTFAEFISESVRIEIYDPKYDYGSGSKANRLRRFLEIEPNYIVGKLFSDFIDNWEEISEAQYDPNYDEYVVASPPNEFISIVSRLKQSLPVPDIDLLKPNSEEKDFEVLAQSVKEYIYRNQPEAGLDRLHAFLVKYFRNLCSKHGITTEREKPLHSLVGSYTKKLKEKQLLESEMTERILKSSISVMEAFNKVRNEQSQAHDNPILGHKESLLIFNYVVSSVRFLEDLESSISTTNKDPVTEHKDDVPF